LNVRANNSKSLNLLVAKVLDLVRMAEPSAVKLDPRDGAIVTPIDEREELL